MKFIQLRFMRLMCDFMMDWYYFRHLPQEAKDRKMQNVNAVREDIVEAMKSEQRREGL